MTFAYVLYAGLIVLSALQIMRALRTGVVGFVFGPERRTRERDPKVFWGVVAFWSLVIAYFVFRMATL